ncbi:MAG TPA: hypothetical protein VIL71_02405 [Spirillospora sp.]
MARKRATRAARPAETPITPCRADRRVPVVRRGRRERARGTAEPPRRAATAHDETGRSVRRRRETAVDAGGDEIQSRIREAGELAPAPASTPAPAAGPRSPEPSGADAAGDGADAPSARDDAAPADGARSPGDAARDGGGDPAPTEPEDHSPVPDMSTTPSGLPVRVPQANLAEPLRTGEPVAAEEPGEPEDPGRSPEEIQRIMGAYQRGTRKGRSDAAKAVRRGRPSGTDTVEGEEDQ